MSLRHSIWFTALLWVLSTSLYAQSERCADFGGLVGAKVSAPVWRDAEIEVEEELRFEGYGGVHLERWLTGVTLETPVSFIPWLGKRLHVGAHAGYVRHHVDEGYFDNRLRVGVDLS